MNHSWLQPVLIGIERSLLHAHGVYLHLPPPCATARSVFYCPNVAGVPMGTTRWQLSKGHPSVGHAAQFQASIAEPGSSRLCHKMGTVLQRWGGKNACLKEHAVSPHLCFPSVLHVLRIFHLSSGFLCQTALSDFSSVSKRPSCAPQKNGCCLAEMQENAVMPPLPGQGVPYSP